MQTVDDIAIQEKQIMENYFELNSSQQAALECRLKKHHSDFSQIVLPDIPDVPGMISESEKKYLYWLTSQCFTGTGAVVEFGTWLGRSTLALSAGLKERGDRTTLYCFDSYEWIEAFNQQGKSAGLDLKQGDDFQPYFFKNVLPYYNYINSTKVSIGKAIWNNGAIEILFLDAPKNRQDISKVLYVFGKYLIPDFSIVVMQDYLYAPSYSIATVVGANLDKLELCHTVTGTSTASYTVTGSFDLPSIPSDWNFTTWSNERILQVWEKILVNLPEVPRGFLEPGLSMLFYDRGEIDLACKLIQKVNFKNEALQRWKFLSNHSYSRNKYGKLFEITGMLN